MRTYHRWLATIFGIFILWIATTGVLSQVGSLVNNGGFEDEARERGARQAAAAAAAIVPPAQAHEGDKHADEAPPAVSPAPAGVGAPASAAAPAGFVCPETMNCRPRRVAKPGEWNLGFLHAIHSGEQFGPVGVILSMLSGLALLFFAFSGLWMYLQMFRARARSGRERSGGKWFWK